MVMCLASVLAEAHKAYTHSGQLAQHELKESEPSWRSEGYAKDSHVEILDHNHGESRIRCCNDAELDIVLVSRRSSSSICYRPNEELG
jgi:hypothetical protein